MGKKNRFTSKAIFRNIVTNFVLVFLVVSICLLCFSPTEYSVSVDVEENNVYRNAEDSESVSLMFNVYWGTDEVYRILETLEKYDAKATFFIGGCWADDNVACLRDIYAKGHEIGNHGYFHKDHTKLSVEQNKKEISDCNRFIELALGIAPTLFAPPSGAYDKNTLSAVEKIGMRTILWSKDTIDWRDKDKTLIYTRATKNVKGGDFILMHPMKATADALEDILQFYKEKSLSLITVSENLQEKEK